MTPDDTQTTASADAASPAAPTTDTPPPKGSGAGLRAVLKKALRDLKAARKRIEELEEEVYELRLGEVLVTMRVPVALRPLALRNRVEATPEAVSAFVAACQAEAAMVADAFETRDDSY